MSYFGGRAPALAAPLIASSNEGGGSFVNENAPALLELMKKTPSFVASEYEGGASV